MLEIYSSFLLAISYSRDQFLGLSYATVMRKDRDEENAIYGVIWALKKSSVSYDDNSKA